MINQDKLKKEGKHDYEEKIRPTVGGSYVSWNSTIGLQQRQRNHGNNWNSFGKGGTRRRDHVLALVYPRCAAETIQKVADQFMEDNPKVNIKIETFSWADFYTKWTTGLASGNVPDMSTALPSQVVEMLDADALIPLDDVIDDIGRNRFSEAALSEGEKDGE